MSMIKKIIPLIAFLFLLVGFTKAPIDITTSSVTDLNRALEEGVINSETLVKLYLERIEEYNSQYNAILYTNENALEEARELDKKRADGDILGTLHGIPIVVKTNIDVKGLATTAGAKAMANNFPNNDSTVVKKLKEAGAIIIGTTNMSEFAFKAGESNSSFGKVRNAYNTAYTPYGSSGGSAVAVATSLAAAGLGTDTNSSVRVPASGNNLVGVRPTIGLVSSYGVIPYDITRDTVGILTKTVKDSALILEAISGVDSKDSRTDKALTKDYSSVTGNLKGKKIGVINTFLKGSSSSSLRANSLTDDEIYNSMLEKISEMESKGAEIVYIDGFFTNYYYNLWNSSLAGFTFCKGFNSYIKNSTGKINSFADLVNSSGKMYDLSGYGNSDNCNYLNSDLQKVYDNREKYQKHVDKVFEENQLDAIVYPTTKNKLLKITNTEGGLRAPSTFVSSVTGYPSITIPLGFDSNNLPYGIEFLSLEYQEDVLYEIISSIENEFIAPTIAPNLYTIPDNVKELVNFYYDDKSWNTENVTRSLRNDLNNLREEFKTFFQNYSSNENPDEEILKLKNEYNKILEERPDSEKQKQSGDSLFKVIGYAIIFLAFIRVLFNKKRSR